MLACTSVQTSGGATYTVAHVGGGSSLDVESSAYANCDIGIYISPANRPYVVNESMVNGPFGVGVYFDGAGVRIAHTLICVNGEIGGSCESGSSSSPGTGLYAQNTPNLKINQTRIDGYAAGFASSPCPNVNNYMSINRSIITSSTYPWSFQGGYVTTLKDSPAPPAGGSCAGSGIGLGFSAPNVYVADTFNNAVKEILAPGYTTVNTLGSGFHYPEGVAVDASGNVFVGDNDNDAVKEILAAGGYTTVNTLGSGFYGPFGVAVDASDNVFVADTLNSAVKEILAPGYTTVNTLGSGFNYPSGVAVDANDNVYVADTQNNAVKEILAAGGYTTVNTLGSGFSFPFGVAVDASDNVYVADALNNAVKEILAPGYTTVNTLGSGFSYPEGVAVDASDNVYVADFSHSAVKEILAAGGYTTVNTLGSGFLEPTSVAVYNPSVLGPAFRLNHRKPQEKR